MNTQMIWANLAVSNLARTTKFYTDLGFKPNGEPNHQLTSFRVGDNEFVIHFFLKEALQANMNMEIADAHQAAEILFTISAESKEKVDQWAITVSKAGGKLLSQPESFGEGYYGFMFADPDGHRYNVFYM
ncbi:VOC family protein [Pedobacter montanisoli]|uniref:VOC family protein n=1 Tax=Pedobacter montanisoli TaxID=2923277 RepID=A0ABS9ZYN6_9SPHI|nr:VOC family protein [Pedobacter montanisoli]MCJ0743418.1 VOC family protein [Pedobacter montanisoli]